MEFYKRKLPSSCISFSSTEGKDLFRGALLAGHMECYFQVAAQFKTQEEPAFCGLSTLIIVLNALEIDPRRVWKGPWRWYHENMLDCCVPLDVIGKRGITMDQFACLAACNMLQVKMVHVDKEASEDHFRELLKSVTKQSDQFLVVSYSRAVLEQTGDGHFSPVGGYNPERDMVLIMDTARFKYPPHWVSLSLLFRAMQAVDPATGLPRGYLVLSRNQLNPALLFRLSPSFGPLGRYAELVTFFTDWNKLLSTKLERCIENGNNVAVLVLEKIIELLARIKNDAHLLTIQFNYKILDKVYHNCCTHHIVQMINSLESLPFFDVVSKETSQVSNEIMSHVGLLPDVGDLLRTSNLPTSEEILTVLESISQTHFLVIFILSWPYEDCKAGTHGSLLHKYVSSQLTQSNPELQKECARVRLQLSSMVGYIKNCHQSSCCNSHICQ